LSIGRTTPFAAVTDGVRVAVQLRPGASATGIDGITMDAEGRPRLAARVSVAAERGKANAALIALLAREWRLPKGSMRVSAGAASRRKTVTLEGAPEALMTTLRAWMGRHGE
jgi:hypothetical protein